MKSAAKKTKYDSNGNLLKLSILRPETRVMTGINNALQTKIYKVLQKSQLAQIQVKQVIKSKISR